MSARIGIWVSLLSVIFFAGAPSHSAVRNCENILFTDHWVTVDYKTEKYCVSKHLCGDPEVTAVTEGWITCVRPHVVAFHNKQISNESQKQLLKQAHDHFCSVTEKRSREIYDNCIVELMPNEAVRYEKREAIISKCKRIACNPSLVESFKY